MRRLSTLNCLISALVWGAVSTPARSAEPAPDALNEKEIEFTEARTALDAVIAENKVLREKLAASESAVTALQKNLAVASSESEIFRRQAGELKLRLEALGVAGAGGNTSQLEQRLTAAVSDLKLVDDERKALHDALIEFSEAVIRFQKSAVTNDPDARVALEVASRTAGRALGITSGQSVDAAPVASTLTDGMVISIKEELGLIVGNLGGKHGVKVGMPFQVFRGDDFIGTVRVVDVREKIAGAVIQNLKTDSNRIKQGDRLRVDARQ
jgi:hypothetical protein